MAIDPEHEHVFVAGWPSTDTVVVLDFDGAILGSIPGQEGASGMVVDQATDTLYVSLRNADAISAVSTVTLAETGRIPLSPLVKPTQVALAGGRLWFGHNCGLGGGTGSIGLDGTGVTDHSFGFPTSCPIFAPNPTNPNTLVSGNIGSSSMTIYVHDVSAMPPTLLVSIVDPGDAGFLNDLRMTPNGVNLLVAGQSLEAVQALHLSDLTLDTTYPTVDGPQAIAVTSDSAFVAAGATHFSGGDDLFVFPAEETEPVRTWEFGEEPEVVPWGLEFAPDAETLFAIVETGVSENLQLRVLQSPTVPRLQTTLGLSVSRSTVSYNQKVTLTASFGGAAAGQAVTIYADPAVGPRTAIASGVVNSAGKVSRTLRVKGKTTFSAEFAGDVTYKDAASANRLVKVRARTNVAFIGFARKSGKHRVYRVGKFPKLTGRVTPNHGGSSLRFVAQYRTRRGWRTFDTGRFPIEATGASHVVLKARIRGNYRVKATFGGDSDHLGSTSAWAHARIT